MKRVDITGQKFGEWVVMYYAGDRHWHCKCSCGVEKDICGNSLKRGTSKNCGNKLVHKINGIKAFKDLTGQQFGKLTVISYGGDSRWNCLCECGNRITRLSKNLSNNSKCDICSGRLKAYKNTDKTVKDNIISKDIDMIGYRINDMEVVKKVADDRYLCRCSCGMTKEIRGYSLRHTKSQNSYKCNHVDVIGKKFGKLVVLERTEHGICKCKCECGNYKEVLVGNLLNGTVSSCGCIKVPMYNKEQVLSKIIEYTQIHNEKPFSKDMAEILGVSDTAIYSYIENYELKEHFNTYYGSKAEKDISNIIRDKTELIVHDRKVLDNSELDLYMPELNLAIEYNGSYWHRYPIKDKYYHQQKTIACKDKGIRLIHIFEYEWEDINKHEKIVNFIKSLVDTNKKILYARQLNVKEIDNVECKEFLNKYHLQGYVSSNINIALTDKDDNIVGLMTFGNSRFDKQYDYELIRLCFKNDIGIIGGSEKMFKYFINKYNALSIVSYCNIAKFSGDSYEKIGFKKVENKSLTTPNYVWVNGKNEVLSRYKTMKHKLIEKGLGAEDQTEDEIMENLGYFKVYDSGNLKLEYII